MPCQAAVLFRPAVTQTNAVIAEVEGANSSTMVKSLTKENGRPSTWYSVIKWSRSLRDYYSITLSERFGLVPQQKINIC